MPTTEPIGDPPPVGMGQTFEFRSEDTLAAQRIAAEIKKLKKLKISREEYDSINPAHYQGFSNEAEVIDIAENLTYNRGAAVKYLARAGNKPGSDLVEDLEKCLWYVQREIERVKRQSDATS